LRDVINGLTLIGLRNEELFNLIANNFLLIAVLGSSVLPSFEIDLVLIIGPFLEDLSSSGFFSSSGFLATRLASISSSGGGVSTL
jgi:hypothetical protein